MLLKILQRFALGHVIRIFLQVTEPELAILPVNVSKTFHAIKLQLTISLSNVIVFARTIRITTRRHRRSTWNEGAIAGFGASVGSPLFLGSKLVR